MLVTIGHCELGTNVRRSRVNIVHIDEYSNRLARYLALSLATTSAATTTIALSALRVSVCDVLLLMVAFHVDS